MAKSYQATQPGPHWVYLQAIPHAPAAIFNGGDIRNACLQAIDQGLIKVHSSLRSDLGNGENT